MLITCPSCASTYDLPFDRIGGAGRKVRCASCRESWFVAAPVEKPSLDIEPELSFIDVTPRAAPPASDRAPDPQPVSESQAADAAAEASASRRRPARAKARGRTGATKARRHAGTPSRSVRRAAMAAALVLALPGLLLLRAEIVALWPGTASLYSALGMPVNLVGLKFAGIRSVLAEESGTPVLEVSGEITNVGRSARNVPPLLISIEGESGEGLYKWSARAAEGELDVGRTIPFRVLLTAPPRASRRVEVTFKDPSGGKAVAALP